MNCHDLIHSVTLPWQTPSECLWCAVQSITLPLVVEELICTAALNLKCVFCWPLISLYLTMLYDYCDLQPTFLGTHNSSCREAGTKSFNWQGTKMHVDCVTKCFEANISQLSYIWLIAISMTDCHYPPDELYYTIRSRSVKHRFGCYSVFFSILNIADVSFQYALSASDFPFRPPATKYCTRAVLSVNHWLPYCRGSQHSTTWVARKACSKNTTRRR